MAVSSRRRSVEIKVGDKFKEPKGSGFIIIYRVDKDNCYYYWAHDKLPAPTSYAPSFNNYPDRIKDFVKEGWEYIPGKKHLPKNYGGACVE